MKVKSTAILFIVIVLSACGHDPWPEEKSDFVGLWHSDNIVIEIMADGNVSYAEIYSNYSETVDAPITEFSRDGFSIGYFYFTKDFKIDQEPLEIEGEWVMILDGVEFTRKQP